jgi:transposase
MKKRDARSIKQPAQEELRKQAIKLCSDGKKKTEIIKQLEISKSVLFKWLKLYKKEGVRSLKQKDRGRPKESQLKNWQLGQLVQSLLNKTPEQFDLPFMLWTRAAIQQLIKQRYKLKLSRWTVGRLLKKLNMTPQKPLKKAYEQNKEKVKEWKEKTYPIIQNQARKENAEILWCDEMGIRSDDQIGRTYGKKGKTPAVLVTGNRYKMNMISAISNRGKLQFMLFTCRFTNPVFIIFLKRLTGKSKRKIYLIVDGHPVHKSKAVNSWLKVNKKKIEIFTLPPYSPELNPDEMLNQDVKTNAVRSKRSKTLSEMKCNLKSYLISRQKTPEVVQRYFDAPTVKYAKL